MAAYLEEDGYRLATGIDVVNSTARELPGILLDSIAARLDAPANGSTDGSSEAAARLRELVPDQHRADYDRLLADARAVFGTRDSNVWVTSQWPQGILRHALLEAARRLLDRGAILERDNVFDSAPGEIPALLRGGNDPSADELARRTHQRVAWAAKAPPLAFGNEGAPPSMEALPAAIAEVTGAMMFLFEIDRRAAEPTTGSSSATEEQTGILVRGMGVSFGRYSGRARVVIEPADFARIESGDVKGRSGAPRGSKSAIAKLSR